MAPLANSPQSSRLVVLLSGAFTLAHLMGILAWSMPAENAGFSFKSILITISACLAWMFLWLFLLDSEEPIRGRLSALLRRGPEVEWAGLALLCVAWISVGALMIIWNDEQSNALAARFLIENGFSKYFSKYPEINSWLGPHHPPLLPIVYAGIYAVLSPNIHVGRAFAIFCSVGASIIAYLWIKRDFGRDAARVSGILLLAMPLVLFNGVASILDAPFWLVFTATFFYFEKYLKTVRTRDAVITGFLVALCLMTRYNGLIVPVLFFFALMSRKDSRSLFLKPATWLIFTIPIVLVLPWFIFALITGTLSVQSKTVLSFFFVAFLAPGGFFYIKSVLLPLIPLMTGLWNVPEWFFGARLLTSQDHNREGARIILMLLIYIASLFLSLPNPRYLLYMAPLLSLLTARHILEIESTEKRGGGVIVFLIGLSVINSILMIHQTSIGNIYLFY
jgi:4-amino-4-deoxy-L-arabinose transferase-like glycosyltransferase